MTDPKPYADARANSGFYAEAAANALRQVLVDRGEMVKLVGLAYLGGKPQVRCTAVIDFDFAGKTVEATVQSVAVSHAIVEKVST